MFKIFFFLFIAMGLNAPFLKAAQEELTKEDFDFEYCRPNYLEPKNTSEEETASTEGISSHIQNLRHFLENDPDPFKNSDVLKIHTERVFIAIQQLQQYSSNSMIITWGLSTLLGSSLVYEFFTKDDIQKYQSLFLHEAISRWKSFDPEPRQEGIGIVMNLFNILQKYQGKQTMTFEDVLEQDRKIYQSTLQEYLLKENSDENVEQGNASMKWGHLKTLHSSSW